MFRSIEDIYKEKKEKEKIAQLPSIRKLKYLALFFISIGIALIITNLIWFETFSPRVILVLRGCAGICAIIFVIIISSGRTQTFRGLKTTFILYKVVL